MENLQINHVPVTLLARILLQLHTIPHNDKIDLLALIAAGLRQYGHTNDLNAFLNYCQAASKEQPWQWGYYKIENQQDWNSANYKKERQLVGLRFLLASELARRNVELIRQSKTSLLSHKCTYNYHNKLIPINEILQDTKSYFEHNASAESSILQQLLDLRLDRFSHDMAKFESESGDLDDAEYHLMGALMVRYDHRSWCLYLRDYIESSEGISWRILSSEEEKKVSCEQALIDIQGIEGQSEFSVDYKPVYLFYGNPEMLTAPLQEELEERQQTVPDANQITWEDYTFEEDYTPEEEPTQEESSICIHCGIEDIVEDVNDIFICESCENGVHQLCENPPIQNYEKEIDPWYCRSCCRAKGLPIPQQPSSLKRKREEELVVSLNNTTKS
ncbi:hypothetical protein G6F43_000247 [Rhizopus delemar]|nr:hypothetical protein G6F43_000247 [Rhizopus delemar]